MKVAPDEHGPAWWVQAGWELYSAGYRLQQPPKGRRYRPLHVQVHGHGPCKPRYAICLAGAVLAARRAWYRIPGRWARQVVWWGVSDAPRDALLAALRRIGDGEFPEEVPPPGKTKRSLHLPPWAAEILSVKGGSRSFLMRAAESLCAQG